MASSRHLNRVLVLQALFSYEFHGGDPEGTLEYVAREFGGKISDLSFAYELLNGVLANIYEIRSLIVQHAPEWPIDKIAPLDRAILEISLFEMLYSKDVPAVVAIDEGIELAKTFGNENSKKFVNGVLNAVYSEKRSSLKPRGEDKD